MEQFEDRSDDRVSAGVCAAAIMETVPLVMRTVRTEMRRHRSDLSVPQFRALGFVRRHPGASLSAVAEHLGLTLSAMSTLMDNLVTRELVVRAINPDNRRRATLHLTALGQSTLAAAHAATQARLAELLATLPAAERGVVVRAMRLLLPIFTPGDTAEPDPPTR
jgi:DNA-binding MarR family transcriptional regulator